MAHGTHDYDIDPRNVDIIIGIIGIIPSIIAIINAAQQAIRKQVYLRSPYPVPQ